MSFHSLTHGFWIAAIASQALLAVVLIARKIWTKFPIFSAYAFFNLFEIALTYAISKNGMTYFYVYWICEAISTMLGLAVVCEIFTALFLPHPALRKLARTIFRFGAFVLLALGALVIYTHSSKEANIGSAVMVVAEATRIVEVGLFMFLFLFSSAFGLHWRENVFGIALGLGIFAAVDLINVTVRSQFGSGVADILNLVRMVAFNLSVLLWTVYLLAAEPAMSSVEVPKRAQLEQWNQAVMELISR
jgi:hypothetical protein